MSCNCPKKVSHVISPPPARSDLPGISGVEPVVCQSHGAPIEPVNDCRIGKALESSASGGTVIPPGWDDATPDYNGEGVRLFGRIGRLLAKLTGTGFIEIRDGLAFVVQSVPLKITSLWHNWYKPAGINKTPVIGEPYPFPMQVIADEKGDLFGIKGLSGEGVSDDSLHVWSVERGQWEARQTPDIPVKQKGLLPRATNLELAGFTPIPASGESDAVRELKVLNGSGIIVVNQQATVPSDCDCEGCQPEAALASVASFLPFPNTEDPDATYTLKWKTTGPYWSED